MKKISLLFACFFVVLSLSASTLYDNLYLVGDGCEAGWDPGAALEMTVEDDGVFTWTGTLLDNSGNRRFKFLVDREWNPSITCRFDVEGHLLADIGTEYDLYERAEHAEGWDNAFQVAVTGTYTVNVNLNTMKMTISAEESEVELPELGQLYLVGSATAAGWENQLPIEMDELSEGVFTWSGDLFLGENDSPGEFKFLNEIGTWDKTINPFGSNDVDLHPATMYELKFRPLESSPGDSKFKVSAAGFYTIEVDLNTMKMKFIQIDYDNLYILGNALTERPGVWSIDDAIEMNKVDVGLFTWKGELFALDTDGEATEFKFINQKEEGNWSNDFVYDEAQSDNMEIVDGETYKLSYRIAGSDNKFQVAESGTYTITVNLYDLEMTIVKDDDDGTNLRNPFDNKTPFTIYTENGVINIVMKDAQIAGSVEVFDIAGKTVATVEKASAKVSLDKLNKGVYLVKINCDNNAYTSKIVVGN